MIKALPTVEGAHAWIAGEGPLRQELEALADKCGVSDRVHFLGWQTNVSGLMAAATVIAFPSRKEPLGNVILEAWALAKPVVATRSQGADFLIRDRENGLLVETDDVAAFSQQLSAVIKRDIAVDGLIKAGRERYEAEFSKAAVVEQYLKFFDNVCGRR